MAHSGHQYITNFFRLFNAERFFEAVSEASGGHKLYLFIAKSTPWADEGLYPDVDTSIENISFDLWRSMLGAVRIYPADVSHVITRVDWNSGTVYPEYDSTSNTSSEYNFFVQSDNKVYKCISNNKGAQSTVQPTQNYYDQLEGNITDRYLWKYMYDFQDGLDSQKFLTAEFMPVRTVNTGISGSATTSLGRQANVQLSAANGAIQHVKINAIGNNHVYLLANITNITSDDTVVNLFVNPDNISKAYTSTNANTATISLDSAFYVGASGFIPNGNSQIATITAYASDTSKFTFAKNSGIDTNKINIGDALHIAPQLVFNGDGTGAVAYANVSTVDGSIERINMIETGSLYTTANVTITANSVGSGANLTPMISPPGGHGKDAIKELGGTSVIVNAEFEPGTIISDTTTYRVIGLLLDPLNANGSVATGEIYRTTSVYGYSGLSGGPFQADETITSTAGGSAVIVEANSTVLEVTEVDGLFPVSNTITGSTSGAQATIANTTGSELNYFSGSFIYVENKQFTQRDPAQTDDFKLVVRF